MRRIPNTSIGLEAEEEGNKVSISAESWARAVDLEIQVPAGSTVRLSTVNDGDIEVENIDGEVEVSNTNGEIRVKNVRGPVSATTVNGDVQVVFRGAMVAAPMAFSTLNGDVDITFPADLKADVRLSSVNGEIYSDFEVVVTTETVSGVDEKPKQGQEAHSSSNARCGARSTAAAPRSCSRPSTATSSCGAPRTSLKRRQSGFAGRRLPLRKRGSAPQLE